MSIVCGIDFSECAARAARAAAAIAQRLGTSLELVHVMEDPDAAVSRANEGEFYEPLRWKIELFHKILKSGCRVEESRLRTAPRLVNLIATCCVVAWRIFCLTMINRSQPAAVPT